MVQYYLIPTTFLSFYLIISNFEQCLDLYFTLQSNRKTNLIKNILHSNKEDISLIKSFVVIRPLQVVDCSFFSN